MSKIEKNVSKSNIVIKTLRKNIKNNKDKDLFIVDDISIIEVVLKNNLHINELFYCEERINNKDTINLLEKIKEKSQEIYKVTDAVFSLLAQKKNSQGIIITVNNVLLNKDTIDLNKYKRVLVTDGIETPGNLGTIYRTADATNFDLIINVDSVTNINNSKCIHSSRGMIFNIPTINCDYDFAQKLINNSNIKPYLGEPDKGVNCFNNKFEEKVIIVVGNERYGINEGWYNNPHKKTYIPMSGYMKSLNVGVATSILMYQVAKDDYK